MAKRKQYSGALDGDSIETSARKITQEGYAACGTSLAPANSIALSTRAPIGHLGIIMRPGCVNQACRLLVLREDIDPRFAYYKLLTARSELQSLGHGTTFSELSRIRLGGVYCAARPALGASSLRSSTPRAGKVISFNVIESLSAVIGFHLHRPTVIPKDAGVSVMLAERG